MSLKQDHHHNDYWSRDDFHNDDYDDKYVINYDDKPISKSHEISDYDMINNNYEFDEKDYDHKGDHDTNHRINDNYDNNHRINNSCDSNNHDNNHRMFEDNHIYNNEHRINNHDTVKDDHYNYDNNLSFGNEEKTEEEEEEEEIDEEYAAGLS